MLPGLQSGIGEPSEQNAFIKQGQCLFGACDGFQMSMGWGLGVSHVLARALGADGEGRKESGLVTLCQMTASGPFVADKSSQRHCQGA